MERREPDFEDERLRYWQAPRTEAHRWESDPVVLDVDLATERLYESRIYHVREDVLVDLAVKSISENPDIPLDEFEGLLTASVDAAFRMMAKQRKEDGLLTFLLVGQFGEGRRPLVREDLVEENRYRQFVAAFEQDVSGVVDPPSIIDQEQWLTYELEGQPPPVP